MRRVLFVDDEPGVLDGLRDLLRRHRKKWDMAFALGGEAALEAFKVAPFDVIVTDMRMPTTDGAALLAVVQREYPQTVRIILSGYAEHEAARRAVRVAHQFLTKPCDAATLENAVERACNLQALITDEKLRQVVGHIGALPSHPAIFGTLTRLLDQPEVTTSEIAALLEQDPAMSAKLLQIVNSAFFGLPRRMTRIEEAVSYLGHSMIRDLALTVSVFSAASSLKQLPVEAHQRHALLTASIARQLVGGRAGDDAFMAGLLHDIGSLILAAELPQVQQQLVESLRVNPRPVEVAEQEIVGVTHEQLGAYLLGLWGLPHAVVEAVAYHHRPSEVEQLGFDLPAVIHVADVLAQEVEGHGIIPGAVIGTIDPAYLETLGVDGSLDEWRAMARSMAAQPAEH